MRKALLKIFWLQLIDPEVISIKYHFGKLLIYGIWHSERIKDELALTHVALNFPF